MNSQNLLGVKAADNVPAVHVMAPPIVPSLQTCPDDSAEEYGAAISGQAEWYKNSDMKLPHLYALSVHDLRPDVIHSFNDNMQIICSALRLAGKRLDSGQVDEAAVLLDHAIGAVRRAHQLANNLIEGGLNPIPGTRHSVGYNVRSWKKS